MKMNINNYVQSVETWYKKKDMFLTSAHNKLRNEKRWALFKLDMKKTCGFNPREKQTR